MSLANRYYELRRLIGGVREKTGYEETFGTPPEELYHVTPVNGWVRRILAEIEFALTLAAERPGVYDGCVGQAIDLLRAEADDQGAIGKDDCLAAEALLMPLRDEAQSYRLILAAHAHIDMNWMWSWHETVAATLSTFRTMLDLMDQYPDFCFSQSQASVYKIVEDFDPALMDRIKARIAEGRWEVAATAWVETDKNMPNTESLLRHIKLTRDYMRDTWGVDPRSLKVDFSPDTFGHSAQVPEIDGYGDVKYYYQCRGLDGDYALYRFRAPSGKELLCYREQHWYNSAITPHIALGLADVARRSGGLRCGLIVYGVGNHGGGATRRDIERAIEMRDWPIFPRLTFGTYREFFRLAESVRDRLPVVDREMNFFATGCYTTQSRIKLGNRKSERALYEADAFGSIAHGRLGAPYAADQYTRAWRNVLFTHFHDILTGSCVQDSREHAMGLYSESMAVANTQKSNALRALSDQIDTSSIETDMNIADSLSEGAGVGYGLGHFSGVPNPERGSGKVRIWHAFNSLPTTRREAIEITVWDWPGDMRFIAVEDAQGRPLPFALIDQRSENYWSHQYFRLLVEADVPALGYATVVLREKAIDRYPFYFNNPVRSQHPFPDLVLENEFLRAQFHPENGALVSLIDKAAGRERIRPGEAGRLLLVHTEAATSSAWTIGRHLGSQPIGTVLRIQPIERGALRRGFVAEQKVGRSKVKQTITLDRHDQFLRVALDLDWCEDGGESVPVLIYHLPLADAPAAYRRDIPAGALTFGEARGDVPGLTYAAAAFADGRALAIGSDCKYGYRAAGQGLAITLLNSSTSPDPYPERGIHRINLAVGVEADDPVALNRFSGKLCCPIDAISGGRHAGSLPLCGSLLTFEGGTVILSAVTTADNGDLLVRYYEANGRASAVRVDVGAPIEAACLVDLMENEVGGARVEGSAASADVAPHAIGALRIRIRR
ncbi:MAG: alpha-mannosidase [Clostridiales bacterium]|nr:alpha-mannosidase [Clostridiales bacterium]